MGESVSYYETNDALPHEADPRFDVYEESMGTTLRNTGAAFPDAVV